MFFISEPASISEQAESISVTQGDPARLECRFSGTKPLKCSWRKAGKELTSCRRYRVQSTDCSSVLNIVKTQTNDSGEYTCEVSNAAGLSSCEASVYVLGQFTPRFHISILFVIFKQTNTVLHFVRNRSDYKTVFHKETEADRRNQRIIYSSGMSCVWLPANNHPVVQRPEPDPD